MAEQLDTLLFDKLTKVSIDEMVGLMRVISSLVWLTFDSADRIHKPLKEALIRVDLKKEYTTYVDLWHNGEYRIVILNKTTNS